MLISIEIHGAGVSYPHYEDCDLIWIKRVDRFGVDSIFKVNGLTIFTCGYNVQYVYQFNKDNVVF